MYVVNKIFGYLTNPVTLAAVGILLSLVVRTLGRKRLFRGLLVLGIVWAWLWATPFMTRKVGVPLERDYLVGGREPAIESHTNAAVIVLHGGSMGDDSIIGGRGEMWTSADRVWTAARLWKVGKAPAIVVTGGEVEASTKGLLTDFGVPTNALVFVEAPRNTEEEVRHVAAEFPSARILVVTSAWHMRRTMMLYAKYAPDVEAIPVPCDFENTLKTQRTAGVLDFWPDSQSLLQNVVSAHEWVGIMGYECLRR